MERVWVPGEHVGWEELCDLNKLFQRRGSEEGKRTDKLTNVKEGGNASSEGLKMMICCMRTSRA